ncbi:MAG: prolyl oligopeptidase family serine peptidase [Litorilituus sp.]|nr:prolyl oligopeptidase family serine peptidase [Litorilituus sp.]
MFFKKLFQAKLLLLLCCFSYSALAVTQASPFFSMPDMTMAKISPEGKSIATIRHQNNKQQITVIDSNTFAEITLIDLAGLFKEKASISELVWIDEHHIAAQLVEVKKGVENLLNTKKSSRLLVIKKPSNTQEKVAVYSVRTKGWLVHPLQEEQGKFLYAKSSIYSKVYKIDVNKLAIEGKKLNKLSKIDGGQFKKSNQVAEINGYATRWFIDTRGNVQAVLHFKEKGKLTLSQLNMDTNNGVTVLNEWSESFNKQDESSSQTNQKYLVPIAIANQADSFYCLDLNEEEERTVYRVNYTLNEEKVVYEADSYKIVDLVLSPDSRELSAVKVIKNGTIENVFLNSEQLTKSQHSSTLVSVVNQNIVKDHSIVYIESHTNPGQFMLKTLSQGRSRLIGERFPLLTNQLSSSLVESSVNVAGLEIPYLISIPNNKEKNHPLIVMPHGGPIGVYDNRYYNPITQFLVANGYAVLQVNFRGSSGYSAELKEAGKKQWGALMLEDIYQATQVVLKRSDIDEQRVCSFGMSYGGYAALMLTLNHPEVYKCAADWAGITDVNLYVNNPRLSKIQVKWVKDFIGNTEKEYQALKDISPTYLAKSLTNPVFIAHGRKDEVVDVEHAYRFKMMLEKFDKNFHWYIDDEGTHSFGTLMQRQVYFEQLNAFMKQYLH